MTLHFRPLSELFGRKKPLLFGFTVFVLFQIPVAVATDVQSVMIFRFFQGVFGSAPQSIAGGALADIWTARERGFAVPMFAGSLFMGPIFGPVVIHRNKLRNKKSLANFVRSWDHLSRKVISDGDGEVFLKRPRWT